MTMDAMFRSAGRLLRPPLADADAPPTRLRELLLIILAMGLLYGAVMGAFPGESTIRPLQMVYSALKVPMLLIVSFALAVPTFYVINTLLGFRDDVLPATRALLAGQAALSTTLASFAPFTALWYCSFTDYPTALVVNGLMFAVAMLTGHVVLRRHYAPLIARDPRHRVLLRIWLVLYGFVAVQMAWVLRPFVGNPERPTTFFREQAWGNAYVEVIRIIGRALGGT